MPKKTKSLKEANYPFGAYMMGCEGIVESHHLEPEETKMTSRKKAHVSNEVELYGHLRLDLNRKLPIKMPRNAYVFFVLDNYFKVDLDVEERRLEWKTMGKHEKARYKNLAKDDKVRFQRQLKKLACNPDYKRRLPKNKTSDVVLEFRK